jgi:hypothetical protein
VQVLSLPSIFIVVKVGGPRAILETHLGPDSLGDRKPLLFRERLPIPRPYGDVNDRICRLPDLAHCTELVNDLPWAGTVRVNRKNRRAQRPPGGAQRPAPPSEAHRLA